MDRILSFIKKVHRILHGIVFGIGLLVVIGMILLITKSSPISFDQPEYGDKDKIYLKIRLAGELLSKSPEANTLGAVFVRMFQEEEREFYVYDLKSVLKHAKQDPQVMGVYLDMGALHGSFAQFTELRDLLSEFKTDGKRLEIWTPHLENKTFYLATLADRLHLAPEGELSIPGPMFQMVYGGEAFRKLGVAFEVIRAGSYKSLFEPLISDTPSVETLKDYLSIEDSLRKHMVSKIAQGRKTGPSNVESWLRRSLYSAKEAFIEKLVDGLSYKEQFEEGITKDCKLVEITKYHPPKSKKPTLLNKEGIAFIEAIGQIFLQSSALSGHEGFDFELLMEELKWAREDADVKALVLRIDSPGGSSLAADLLWEEVRRVSEVKPVVVSMGGYAASGGYYMAAPATKIFALPTTITGSIGVIGLIPNFEAFRQKYGVSFHVVSESDRKNLLNPGSKMTVDDKKILEAHVQSTYEGFVNRVASGRKKTFQEIDSIAQGRVWTGEQAKELGLVDQLGGLAEAFHEAKQLAKLNVDQDYPILRYHAPSRSFKECLRSGRLGSCLVLDMSHAKVPNLNTLPLLQVLARWTEQTTLPREQVLALLPHVLVE